MKGRYDLHSAEAKAAAQILVVDDDVRNLKIIGEYLSHAGYDVRTASSGAEALAQLSQGGIELVILDVRMPVMGGFEVCRRIRNDPTHAKLPIIFLTADFADEEREFEGLEIGGDEFLRKPLSYRVLAARVKNLLRLADAERERRLLSQIAQSEKLAAIGQIAAGVAHEINNPLSFILSNLQSLKAYFDDLRAVVEAYRRGQEEGEKTEQRLDTVSALDDIVPLLSETVEGGQRVRTIVQELKTFSRSDEGRFEEFDLAEIVRSTLLLTEREFSAKCTVVKELEMARIVSGPKGKLHQVTLNLVVNAIQAMEARPLTGNRRHQLRVATHTEGDCAVLVVSDTGCGIPAANLKRIFEPFFTTKAVGVGTGIGLAVCAMVVDRMGGTIDIDSRVGEGTTFTLRIPCEARREQGLPQEPTLSRVG